MSETNRHDRRDGTVTIAWVTPALIYRLRQLGVREDYLTASAALLLQCWAQGICAPAKDLLKLCSGDPICELVKTSVKTNDIELAYRLKAWYAKCSGRRLVKLIDVEGRIEALDYTEQYIRKWPPPDVPCR